MTNLNAVAKKLDKVVENTKQPDKANKEKANPLIFFKVASTPSWQIIFPQPAIGYYHVIRSVNVTVVPDATVANRSVVFVHVFPGLGGTSDADLFSSDIVASATRYITWSNAGAEYISTQTAITSNTEIHSFPWIPFEVWSPNYFYVSLANPQAGDIMRATCQYEVRSVIE